MSAVVGQSLDGRYLLRRVIWEGKRTVIYEGQNLVTNRLVAMKMLADDRLDDPKARHALLEEARLLSAAQHPCVVDVIDAGTAELDDEEATAFVAMELIEGRTFDGHVAANRRLDVAETLRIGLALLRGLHWLHRLGLVHGALNSRHVLLPTLHPAERSWDVRPYDPKIIGFGAAARDAIQDKRTASIADAGYLSPEQVVGESATPRSDIYSAAAMIYQALTGTVPTPGQAVTPAKERREETPDAMSDALGQALLRDPKARPQSAQELGEDLQKSGRKLPPPKPSPGQKRRRHLRAPYITPIRLMRGDHALDGRCEDISIAGMLIVTTATVPKDAKFNIRFALPGTSRFVDEPATVRWSRGNKGRTCASGLSFDTLSAASISALEKYLDVYGVAPVAS